MKITFQFPVKFYLCSSSKTDLDLDTKFTDKDYNVVIKLIGEEILALKNDTSSEPFFRTITSINFETELSNHGEKLFESKLFDDENKNKLVKFISNIINRTVRNIRNFGYVSFLNEIDPSIQKPDYLLDAWKVIFSFDGIEKIDFSQHKFISIMSLSEQIVTHRKHEDVGSLSSDSWKNISEGIQRNISQPAEKEFFVNAFEHLEKRNFRYSVLEAVMGLEILVTNYLEEALKNHHGYPKKDVDELLGPDLSLKLKISIIIRLLLPMDVINKIDFDSVKRGINIRNKIMHKGGKIPRGYPEDQLKKNIRAILYLSGCLNRELFKLQHEIICQKIIQNLKVSFGFFMGKLESFPDHYFLAEFDFGSKEINKETLDQILETLILELMTFDKYFLPLEHLQINFRNFIHVKFQYLYGKLFEVNSPEKKPT